ncbi:MAG TPA: hypothetical protein VIP05_22685, partial [Burkholderiaceae bacterium]
LWIAACAHRLQQRWHTVDALELEDVARTLWRDARLRAMWPEDAAADWLRPVARPEECGECSSGPGPSHPSFSLTGKPSPAGQPVRGP